jgi:hypothetical protein
VRAELGAPTVAISRSNSVDLAPTSSSLGRYLEFRGSGPSLPVCLPYDSSPQQILVIDRLLNI